MREPPRQTPKAAFLLPAEEKSDRPFRGGRRRTGLCATRALYVYRHTENLGRLLHCQRNDAQQDEQQ